MAWINIPNTINNTQETVLWFEITQIYDFNSTNLH